LVHGLIQKGPNARDGGLPYTGRAHANLGLPLELGSAAASRDGFGFATKPSA
jgi:hypothetical protein